ncbi:MAG: hypothetical protein ACR2GF_05775 [Acidimicrobiales bacterium]
MSFVLVVVAAITLVIGLLQSGLGIIYVSIACSVLAGIVLATAVLRGRPEPRTAGGPSAGRRAAEGAIGTMRRDEPASTPPAAPDSWVQPDRPAAPLPSPTAEPVSAGALAAGQVAVVERDDATEAIDRVDVDDAAPDDDFPIHDYDRLRATEILPMLSALSDDQIEAVEGRERGGKNRAMILKRTGSEKQSREAAWDANDEGWEVEPEPAPEPPLPSEPMQPDVMESPIDDRPPVRAGVGEFPIPDFDDLRALEVLGRLPDLSVSELHLVRRREEDGLRRAMVLNRIDRLIEEAPEEPEPVVVPPVRRRAASTSRKSTSATPADATIEMAEPTMAPASKRPRTAKATPAAAPAAVAPATRGRTSKAATVAPAKKAAAPSPRKVAARKAAAQAPTVVPTKKAPGATTKASASTRKAVAEARASAAKVGPAKKAAPRKR